MAAAMLYLNMILLGRRHWANGEASRAWARVLVRVMCVILALFSLSMMIERLGMRATPVLKGCTRSQESIEPRADSVDKPVLIQAYWPRSASRIRETKSDLLEAAQGIRGADGARSSSTWFQPTLLDCAQPARFAIEPKRRLHGGCGQADLGRDLLGPSPPGWRKWSSVLRPGSAGQYELTRLITPCLGADAKMSILSTDAKMMGDSTCSRSDRIPSGRSSPS
jgi:ABC-2 type transport system permease protein